jgi:hypothetical protein
LEPRSCENEDAVLDSTKPNRPDRSRAAGTMTSLQRACKVYFNVRFEGPINQFGRASIVAGRCSARPRQVADCRRPRSCLSTYWTRRLTTPRSRRPNRSLLCPADFAARINTLQAKIIWPGGFPLDGAPTNIRHNFRSQTVFNMTMGWLCLCVS